MGGYAVYIWPAFLVAGLVMASMAIVSLRSFTRAHRALERLQKTIPSAGNET